MRIVYMGSPGLAVPPLEHLLLNRYEVVAVYTPPDRPAGRGRALVPPPVKEAARRWGLPVFQPETLKTPEAQRQLADLKPEVVVICAFGQILPEAVLELPPLKCVNVHFSLLPRYRGASPVAAAILAGDTFTGVTIMIVTPKLDTGPVLARAAVAVSPRDTTGLLAGKLSRVGAGLLQEALVGWSRGEISPRPQDEAGATYFPRIRKEEGEIDWHLPAVEIWRRVRAFNPWPGCYTRWRGRQLKIVEAVPLPGDKSAAAGTVIALPGQEAGLAVGTGEGVLRVLEVQLEGKRAMPAAEFLRGQRDFPGAVLPD
ncbi:MAG TPA: methionyl-tRNA formyltransferase [Dehalococcoidales bacterium]|nr:methionyl-tRNA formyltransferase [Dehalococcoidales bacterium]